MTESAGYMITQIIDLSTEIDFTRAVYNITPALMLLFILIFLIGVVIGLMFDDWFGWNPIGVLIAIIGAIGTAMSILFYFEAMCDHVS